MQRFTYVCTSCRRSIPARIFSVAGAKRTVHISANGSQNGHSTSSSPASPQPNLRTQSTTAGSFTIKPKSTVQDPPGFSKDSNIEKTRQAKRLKHFKKSKSFYDEVAPRHSALLELNDLSQKLNRDSKLVSRVYPEFEKFLSRNSRKNQESSQRDLLLQHQLPRQLFKCLLQHRSTIEDLPSIPEVLIRFAEYGFNDDILWADAMFDYIRNEFYDDAVELWKSRLSCENRYPVTFMSQLSGPDSEPRLSALSQEASTPSARQLYDSPCHVAVAAATAFLQSRRFLMMATEVPDLLRFLEPRRGNISKIMPKSTGVRHILTENEIEENLVDYISTTLRDLRPYGEFAPSHRSYFDRAVFAGANQDVEEIRRIYRDANSQIPERDRRRSFYVSFINAFMQCRSRKDGDIVWNHMLECGFIPNAKIWGSWLDGCAKARDIELFLESWNRMLSTGIAPDNVCWTIRMQLHFMLKDTEGAKLCLQGMANNNVPIATGTVNVALKELNNAGLYNDSADLIKWALNYGIQADTVTYNLILDFRVKMNDFKGVLKTLQAMDRTNVPTDLISYGVIIRGLYQQSSIRPDRSFIHVVLAEMKAKKISPNLQFYNTIIYGMLNRFFDIEGALYILSLMPNDTWRGSSHTSSIFIRYYSRMSNLAAVEAVWANMRQNAIAPDEGVYNATVLAYSRAGMKDKMMEYLNIMFRLRKSVATTSYIWALKCLMKHEDFATAKKIFAHMQSRNIDIGGHRELKEMLYHLGDQAAADSHQSQARII